MNQFSLYLPTFIETIFTESFLIFSIIGLLWYCSFNKLALTQSHSSVHHLGLIISFSLLGILWASSFYDQTWLITFGATTYRGQDYYYWIKFILLVSVVGWWLITETLTFKISEFSIFILVSIFGLSCLIHSFDFISLYLALELQALSSYILAGLKKNSVFSTEAGLKYFILGALASGFYLLGCALIYGSTGTTNFEQLITIFINFEETSLLILGSIFLLSSILFKLAAAPFHIWSPDVYEGAPSEVTAFFTIIPKVGGIFMLINLIYYLFYDVKMIQSWWIFIGASCSLVSVLIGSLGALSQLRLKRLFAYSSIGHIGYLLLGSLSISIEGIQATYFYLIIYIITSLCFWGSLLSIHQETITKKKLVFLSELTSLYQYHPFLCINFIISFFSLAGIPPLIGFLSKAYIFMSTLNSSLYLVSLIVLLISVISAFYYCRIIKLIIFEYYEFWNGQFYTSKLSKLMSLFLSGLFFSLLILFITPNLLSLFSYYLAISIF